MTTACHICQQHTTRGNLCDTHHQHLTNHLHGITHEAAALNPIPTTQRPHNTTTPPLASERAPARLDVLVHLDHRQGRGDHETDDDRKAAGNTLPALATLTHWANLIREERNYATRATRTITTETRTILDHLDHATHQPWAATMYTELRTLHTQLRAANGTAPDKPVGRCYLPTDTTTCNGPIWIDHANGHAHCGRCRSTWDGHQLALLSYELERARREAERPHTDDGHPMHTAAELVALGHAPNTNALRVAAHRAGTRSINGYYDARKLTRHETHNSA